MKSRERLSIDEARRLALAAQGLADGRPAGDVDADRILETVRRLGLVQLDFVNVLEPAHHQVLFSRLGPFDRGILHELLYDRYELTEQWAHEASIIPVESWPMLRHRMRAHRPRPRGFAEYLDEHPEYVEAALGRVREEGPITGEELPDLPDGLPQRILDAWGWGSKVKRQVLEAHFGAGRLAIAARRSNFQRVYDLAERVVPEEHLSREVEEDEARRRLLVQAARAHGVATARDLADYWRMKVRPTRARLAELVESGRLLECRVDGWDETAYLHPDSEIPDRIEAAALLSPFDPVIWTRERAERVFDFEYRNEMFTPEAERRWGYYVLPFLLGDRLVARADLKADRDEGRLRVLAAYREGGTEAGEVAAALARELGILAGWLGLEEVSVEPAGDLAGVLAAVVD